MKTRFISILLALVMLLGLCAVHVSAANPYLPLWERIPDGEPYVFPDPDTGEQRVYIYGSHDSNDFAQHCGREHAVWSAPVDDLTDWRWEGEAFNISQLEGATYLTYPEEGDPVETKLELQDSYMLYAPDVAYNPVTEKYYFYTFVSGPGNLLFVASSDRPAGPFTDPQFIPAGFGEAATVLNMFGLGGGFDPGVLVDMDNPDEEGYPTVYLYYGFMMQSVCQLSGKDMKTILPGTHVNATTSPESVIWNSKPEGQTVRTFFEASSPRKIGDMYVLVYSGQGSEQKLTDGIGTLDYAYSDSPLGPWTYGGSIIDSRGDVIDNPYNAEEQIFTYCNWESNTHGGLVEIDGQWYIFYHRQTSPARSERQGMIEPVDVRVEDGKVIIDQVEMTSQGAEKVGLNPYESHDAGIACYIVSESSDNENPENTTRVWAHSGDINDWDPSSDVEAKAWNPIINIKNNTVIGYKYFNFGSGASPESGEFYLELTLTEGAAGTVNVYANDPIEKYGDAEKPRTLVGTAALDGKDSDVHTVRIDLEALSGKKGIYLEFLSENEDEICRLNALKFVNKSAETPFHFEDVQNEKAFYYDAVYWAFNADPQITNGTDDTHFSPDAGCTRAQAVTFLWRASGEPAPKNDNIPFDDVQADAYYAKAVAWAVEQGITKGTSETRFSPNATCTRAQIVTFLWRCSGSPEAKDSASFADVKAGEYYEAAVAWAVEQGVTNGTSADKFSPDATCTRGQIVSFLYRALA